MSWATSSVSPEDGRGELEKASIGILSLSSPLIPMSSSTFVFCMRSRRILEILKVSQRLSASISNKQFGKIHLLWSMLHHFPSCQLEQLHSCLLIASVIASIDLSSYFEQGCESFRAKQNNVIRRSLELIAMMQSSDWIARPVRG